MQPNRVNDNLRWETETFVVWGSGVCFHEAILAHCSVMLQVDNTLYSILTIEKIYGKFLVKLIALVYASYAILSEVTMQGKILLFIASLIIFLHNLILSFWRPSECV